MKIQRFEAATVEEALRQAQEVLGPEALVLHTRQVDVPRGPTRVEVVAAIDRAPWSAVANLHEANGEGYAPSNGEWSRDGYLPAPPEAAPSHPHWEDEVAALRRDMDLLRSQLREQAAPSGTRSAAMPPAPARPSLFAPTPAPAPARTPSDPTLAALTQRVRAELATRTITLRPGRCTTVALAGPTGVGKTTTLAKIAAAAALGERKRVAIINLDTYRIGAMEQIEAYARLLQTPLTLAYTVPEVRAARERYADYDLVLVDTTGRSPRNTTELENLALLLEAARPEEVHLLLEMRDSAASHAAVLQGFKPLRPTHVLLTKLDEAASMSEVLSTVLSTALPVSYYTCGQRVPEDLAPATADALLAELGRSR